MQLQNLKNMDEDEVDPNEEDEGCDRVVLCLTLELCEVHGGRGSKGSRREPLLTGSWIGQIETNLFECQNLETNQLKRTREFPSVFSAGDPLLLSLLPISPRLQGLPPRVQI